MQGVLPTTLYIKYIFLPIDETDPLISWLKKKKVLVFPFLAHQHAWKATFPQSSERVLAPSSSLPATQSSRSSGKDAGLKCTARL